MKKSYQEQIMEANYKERFPKPNPEVQKDCWTIYRIENEIRNLGSAPVFDAMGQDKQYKLSRELEKVLAKYGVLMETNKE